MAAHVGLSYLGTHYHSRACRLGAETQVDRVNIVWASMAQSAYAKPDTADSECKERLPELVVNT